MKFRHATFQATTLELLSQLPRRTLRLLSSGFSFDMMELVSGARQDESNLKLKNPQENALFVVANPPSFAKIPPEILGKNNEKYIQISVDFFLQNGKNHPIVNQFCPVNCFMKQSSQHADRFVRPDVVTYGSAIAACASGTHWQQATGPTVVTVGDLGPTIAKIVFPLTAADLEMFRGRYIWHIVINCIYCIIT